MLPARIDWTKMIMAAGPAATRHDPRFAFTAERTWSRLAVAGLVVEEIR